MGEIAVFAMQLLNAIPSIVSIGATVQQVGALVNSGLAKIQTMQAEGRGPTEQEKADLDAEIKALRDELHAPE